jgi:hypothetical protein
VRKSFDKRCNQLSDGCAKDCASYRGLSGLPARGRRILRRQLIWRRGVRSAHWYCTMHVAGVVGSETVPLELVITKFAYPAPEVDVLAYRL